MIVIPDVYLHDCKQTYCKGHLKAMPLVIHLHNCKVPLLLVMDGKARPQPLVWRKVLPLLVTTMFTCMGRHQPLSIYSMVRVATPPLADVHSKEATPLYCNYPCPVPLCELRPLLLVLRGDAITFVIPNASRPHPLIPAYSSHLCWSFTPLVDGTPFMHKSLQILQQILIDRNSAKWRHELFVGGG